MHYYQHHIGDFQRDTASLSDSDTMAYLRLIWMYYDTEQPLPADAKKLAFKIGSNPDSVQMILDTFFVKDEQIYRHKRCDKVLNEIYSKSEQARAAAKARWDKNADAMHEQCNSNTDALKIDAYALKIDATHNPIPNTHKKEYIDRFNVFWKQYPRKVAKPNAEKAWLKIKPDDVVLKKMLDAINQQGLPSKEIQFVPHPATWLNAKRWEDEVATASSGSYEWFVNDRRIK
jgi:uncharacterized protein YdaU (DUF1376 family)